MSKGSVHARSLAPSLFRRQAGWVNRAAEAGGIEMDWAKPVAQSALVALIFIRWLRADGRREPRWGSAIYDRCDAEAGERHFVEREKKMKKTTSGRDGWVGWG